MSRTLTRTLSCVPKCALCSHILRVSAWSASQVLRVLELRVSGSGRIATRLKKGSLAGRMHLEAEVGKAVAEMEAFPAEEPTRRVNSLNVLLKMMRCVLRCLSKPSTCLSRSLRLRTRACWAQASATVHGSMRIESRLSSARGSGGRPREAAPRAGCARQGDAAQADERITLDALGPLCSVASVYTVEDV